VAMVRRRLRTTLTRARSASDPEGRSRPPRPTADRLDDGIGSLFWT
jgi:hypothetical protein